jgi:hypothetical protein
MSSPAPLEPLRKNTQIAEAGPSAATAEGMRASSSTRVRTNRNTRSALAGLTNVTPLGALDSSIRSFDRVVIPQIVV